MDELDNIQTSAQRVKEEERGKYAPNKGIRQIFRNLP